MDPLEAWRGDGRSWSADGCVAEGTGGVVSLMWSTICLGAVGGVVSDVVSVSERCVHRLRREGA